MLSSQAHKVKNEDDFKKYILIGRSLYDAKNYSEAIMMYKKALQTKSLSAIAMTGIGNCYFRLNNAINAISWYKKAIRFDRSIKEAFNGLANAYELNGDSDEALKSFEKAIQIDHKFSYPYNGIGNFHFKKGDYQIAVKWYEDAATLEQGSVEIKLNLSRCYIYLRKYHLAYYEFEKVSKIIKQDSKKYEDKFELILEQFREILKTEAKSEVQKMKMELSKSPFMGQMRSPESIDILKAIKDLLNFSPKISD